MKIPSEWTAPWLPQPTKKAGTIFSTLYPIETYSLPNLPSYPVYQSQWGPFTSSLPLYIGRQNWCFLSLISPRIVEEDANGLGQQGMISHYESARLPNGSPAYSQQGLRASVSVVNRTMQATRSYSLQRREWTPEMIPNIISEVWTTLQWISERWGFHTYWLWKGRLHCVSMCCLLCCHPNNHSSSKGFVTNVTPVLREGSGNIDPP